MDNINDTLFTHWNTDSNGNPVSVACNEDQVVSPIHLCVQLNQIPDDFQTLNVYYNGHLMNECYDNEVIGSDGYKVDYGDGIVWFNRDKAGKTIHFEYYGRGYKVISAKRVMINDGAYVESNTLQHLIDLNKQAVDTVNSMQANLDDILADFNSYSDQLKINVDRNAEQTLLQMQRSYSDLYSKMDKYVGEVLKYKTQAVNEMKGSLNLYVQEVQAANEALRDNVAQFETKYNGYLKELEDTYDESIESMTALMRQMQDNVEGLQRALALFSEQQKQAMVGKTEDLERHKNSIKQTMTDDLNALKAYVTERKNTIDKIVSDAQKLSTDLRRIFEVQQVEWESEFDDAELERLQTFLDAQTTKQHEFDMAQTARDREFTETQADKQELFDEAEANRDEVFNAMKEMAYDENAILKGVQLSNTKIDDVELERVYQEVDNPLDSGGVRRVLGDKLTFTSNVVKEDGTTAKEKVKELFLIGRESTWKGTQPPIDTETVWYDVSEEDWKNIPLPQDVNLQQFQDAVNQIRAEVSDVRTSVKLEEVRPGTFFNEGSTSASVDKTIDKDGNEVPNRTITTNKIKVGLNPKLMQLEEGELAYCMDTETLYIGVRKNEVSTLTINKKIGGQTSGGGETGGGTNLTGEYLQLDGKDGNKYRIYIDEDGELKQRLVEFLDAEKPSADQGARYEGLLVNRYFGGGERGNGLSPLSHGFIELYNNAANERNISLNGLALYYKTIDDPTWRRFELHGYIPWHCSYLIRGARVNSMDKSSCRYEISKFDQQWDRDFSNTSAMIYLGVDTGALTIVNPYNLNDGTISKSYINILAGAGVNEERSLTAVEYDKKKTPSYRRLLTPDCGIQRRDFASTKNTYKDIEQVNYRTCDMSIYRPRCVEDGPWDFYYNKTKLNENIPNLVNIQYGKQWHTRTFTWQSKVMNRGYLRYRKVGSSQWIYKDTNTQIVYHKDGDCTIHRCIVRNLPEGVYEYQCGDEGYWGDIYTFKVKSYQTSDGTPDRSQHIKFLQVSDQQSNDGRSVE